MGILHTIDDDTEDLLTTLEKIERADITEARIALASLRESVKQQQEAFDAITCCCCRKNYVEMPEDGHCEDCGGKVVVLS